MTAQRVGEYFYNQLISWDWNNSTEHQDIAFLLACDPDKVFNLTIRTFMVIQEIKNDIANSNSPNQ